MWRKGEAFDVNPLNVVSENHVRTRTVYWRIKRPMEEAVTVCKRRVTRASRIPKTGAATP